MKVCWITLGKIMKYIEYSELPYPTVIILSEAFKNGEFNFVSKREYGCIKECAGDVYFISINNRLMQFPDFIKTEAQALELLKMLDISYQEGENNEKQRKRIVSKSNH